MKMKVTPHLTPASPELTAQIKKNPRGPGALGQLWPARRAVSVFIWATCKRSVTASGDAVDTRHRAGASSIYPINDTINMTIHSKRPPLLHGVLGSYLPRHRRRPERSRPAGRSCESRNF